MFGCCVWFEPSAQRTAKVQSNLRKGIFLGFVANTTPHNIVWFDIETEHVKIAKHAHFDKGMNDPPPNNLPPNALHLQQSEFGNPVQPDGKELSSSDLHFTILPFDQMLTKNTGGIKCNSPTFGIQPQTNEINNCAFI